jgi:AcrR family transcriptional regulator
MEPRGAEGPEQPLRVSTLTPPNERERLIAAMAASCAERGYAATRVDDVIVAAKVSRASFDQNFAGKADCALAAVGQILAEITREVASATTPERNDWEKLIGAVRALLELMAARPSAARLACGEARFESPPGAYVLYESGIRVLVAMLDRSRTYATASPPPSATRGAIGGAEALIRRELLAGRPERLPDLLPDIVYGLLVPYLDQQEALRYMERTRETMKQGGVG